MALVDIAPFLGILGLSVAMSCLSTICWFRQSARVQELQRRVVSIEQRPIQQFQLLAQDTGYGQAYQYPLPTVPATPSAPPAPIYYAPPLPPTNHYGTNVV
jgi:hypothetical protein